MPFPILPLNLFNYEKSFASFFQIKPIAGFLFFDLKKSDVSKGNTLSRLTSKPI